ncbi:nostrin [Acrasis kona]|uniref:Nostrin n=1 Tax=Acrasis kona TaxID=1008807 RepID=A0AAW2Z8W4_9EUKA
MTSEVVSTEEKKPSSEDTPITKIQRIVVNNWVKNIIEQIKLSDDKNKLPNFDMFMIMIDDLIRHNEDRDNFEFDESVSLVFSENYLGYAMADVTWEQFKEVELMDHLILGRK